MSCTIFLKIVQEVSKWLISLSDHYEYNSDWYDDFLCLSHQYARISELQKEVQQHLLAYLIVIRLSNFTSLMLVFLNFSFYHSFYFYLFSCFLLKNNLKDIFLQDKWSESAIQYIILNLLQQADFCLYLKIFHYRLTKASYNQNMLFVLHNTALNHYWRKAFSDFIQCFPRNSVRQLFLGMRENLFEMHLSVYSATTIFL